MKMVVFVFVQLEILETLKTVRCSASLVLNIIDRSNRNAATATTAGLDIAVAAGAVIAVDAETSVLDPAATAGNNRESVVLDPTG